MKMKFGLPFAGLAVSGWLTTADRADASATNMPDNISGPGIGYLIWVIVALALVIGLIMLSIKWLSTRNRGWSGNRALRSLGGIPLGQNKSLQVVELSGRIYVVGVGDSITLLDKIDDPAAYAAVLEAIEQQHGRQWSAPSLSGWIGRLRGRGNPQPDEERWQEASSFEELLHSKLKRQADQKQKMEELLKEQNHNDRLSDE